MTRWGISLLCQQKVAKQDSVYYLRTYTITLHFRWSSKVELSTQVLAQKFQILTQTNRLVHACLTYFRRYTFSGSHLGLMMSYNVTGGGPMEAPIVELSEPVLVINIYFRRYSQKCKKSKVLLSLVVALHVRTVLKIMAIHTMAFQVSKPSHNSITRKR